MMTESMSCTLNNGVVLARLGLGVFEAPAEQTVEAVRFAIAEAGYRHIDTASVYGNEAAVGEGIRASGAARDEIFVTTKVWTADQGHAATLRAIDASLARLGMDHVDLYLVHWPCPSLGLIDSTWEAMEEILASGRARAIGVCNHEPHHLQRILDLGGTVPAVDQIELHPHLPQWSTQAFNRRHGVQTEAWSPLGGTTNPKANGGAAGSTPCSRSPR
jgi:2,5-diketo-D-gluconate reductase A